MNYSTENEKLLVWVKEHQHPCNHHQNGNYGNHKENYTKIVRRTFKETNTATEIRQQGDFFVFKGRTFSQWKS